MAGEATPVHGGAPGLLAGCGGCTDCCHLPEISVTGEEAIKLSELYDRLDQPAGMLVILEDPSRQGWRVMRGPCAFRSINNATTSGCRIYQDRPGSCRVFTCRYLLELRRGDANSEIAANST